MSLIAIKKESPNEGTETIIANNTATARIANKKRIPEWGDGNYRLKLDTVAVWANDKKRIPEWGDGNIDGLPPFPLNIKA